ncbi:MAG: cytochrome c [Rhodospirillaceae bacterium]|nr:cytochrome c [Rhodospirillaceae bacterium]
MKNVLNVLGGVALAALVAAPVSAADKDTIDYRINVMKSLGEQASALGKILQNKVPRADNLAIHAETIALQARAAQTAFADKVVGGTAKADVWDNWADFSARFANLEKAALDVAEAAKSGGLAAAQPKIQAMLTCKACHDIYRTPQN